MHEYYRAKSEDPIKRSGRYAAIGQLSDIVVFNNDIGLLRLCLEDFCFVRVAQKRSQP